MAWPCNTYLTWSLQALNREITFGTKGCKPWELEHGQRGGTGSVPDNLFILTFYSNVKSMNLPVLRPRRFCQNCSHSRLTSWVVTSSSSIERLSAFFTPSHLLSSGTWWGSPRVSTAPQLQGLGFRKGWFLSP